MKYLNMMGLVAILYSCDVKADTTNNCQRVNAGGLSAIIDVEIADSNASHTKGELLIRLNDYLSFRYPNNIHTRTYVKKVNNQDLHRFPVQLSDRTNFMEVDYMSPVGNGSVKRSGFFLKQFAFLIRDGDSIRIRINKDSLGFRGKGAVRLNLQLGLESIENDYKFDANNMDSNAAAYVQRFITLRKKIAEQQITLLNGYKDSVEQEVYNRLYFDIIGRRNLTLISVVNAMMVGGASIEKEEKDRFNRVAYQILMESLPDFDVPFSDDWHQSPYFMDYLLFKELFLIKQMAFGTKDSKEIAVTEDELYRILTEKYAGRIKERLLLMGASYLIRNELPSENYLHDISRDITTWPYRDLALSLYANRGVGKLAYEFSLPDSSGNLVNLADFHGKAVVVDFWFTGCIPCRNLKKMMEPIISYYKKKEVVFITISVDKSIEFWKEKGIKSGLYTHKGGIDLITNGQGQNAPIVKHYNLTGYPSLLIIDKKGKLISASPPRPSSNDNIAKLKSLIDLAIDGG